MGKKSRRKRHHQQNNDSSQLSKKIKNETNKVKKKETNKISIIKRIGHENPEIRAAALSMLLVTHFSPKNLMHLTDNTCFGIKKEVLLEALLSSFSDVELDTAINAVGCIQNFINFSPCVDVLHNLDICCILLSRIQISLDYLCSKGMFSPGVRYMAEWRMLSQCLSCLTALIESYPESIDKLENESCSASDVSFMSMIDNSLSYALKAFEAFRELEQKEETCKMFIYITQSLHASLDENISLCLSLIKQESLLCKLETIIKSEKYPNLSRLHFAGCILTIEKQLYASSSCSITIKEESIFSNLSGVVFSLLYDNLEYDNSHNTKLSEQIQSCYEAHIKDVQDQTLEKQVLDLQKTSKESARSIAKRLKQTSKMNKVNNSSKNKETNSFSYDDPYEEYLNAQKTWKNSLQPLTLSLEICTNLCFQDDDDEREITVSTDQGHLLLDDIVKYRIPHKIYNLFIFLCTKVIVPKNISVHTSPYNIICHELEELQLKCSACLSNMFQNIFLEVLLPNLLEKENNCITLLKQKPSLATIKVWNSFRLILHTPLSIRTLLALTNVMASFLSVIDSLDDEFLKESNLWIQLLDGDYPTKTNNKEELNGIYEMKRNIISIIGMLVTKPNTIATKVQVDFVNTMSISFKKILLQKDHIQHSSLFNLQNEILNIFLQVFSQQQFEIILNQNNILKALECFSFEEFKTKVESQSEEENEDYEETSKRVSTFIQLQKCNHSKDV